MTLLNLDHGQVLCAQHGCFFVNFGDARLSGCIMHTGFVVILRKLQFCCIKSVFLR